MGAEFFKCLVFESSKYVWMINSGFSIPSHDSLRLGVVYFDQCLGVAHYKRWLKYAFSTFFVIVNSQIVFSLFIWE